MLACGQLLCGEIKLIACCRAANRCLFAVLHLVPLEAYSACAAFLLYIDKKMSQDIVITVQKADIGSNRITPPTAQENLTYTGQAQALITAGSVTNYGTMQYSLTENGT